MPPKSAELQKAVLEFLFPQPAGLELESKASQESVAFSVLTAGFEFYKSKGGCFFFFNDHSGQAFSL